MCQSPEISLRNKFSKLQAKHSEINAHERRRIWSGLCHQQEEQGTQFTFVKLILFTDSLRVEINRGTKSLARRIVSPLRASEFASIKFYDSKFMLPS